MAGMGDGRSGSLPARLCVCGACVCLSRSQKLQLTPPPRPAQARLWAPAPRLLACLSPLRFARSPGPEQLLRSPVDSSHHLTCSFVRGEGDDQLVVGHLLRMIGEMELQEWIRKGGSGRARSGQPNSMPGEQTRALCLNSPLQHRERNGMRSRREGK